MATVESPIQPGQFGAGQNGAGQVAAGQSGAAQASLSGTTAVEANGQENAAERAKDASADLSLEERLDLEERDAGLSLNPITARLPVELDVSIVVHEFRVRHLLNLEPGQIIETRWSHGQDLPLAAGRQRLAWTEFEVVDTTMAVRITHLL